MSYAALSSALSSTLSSESQWSHLKPIDVVAYDACVASQIEVLHTWRPVADYYAGSQDYVGWGGVDYATVIGTIRADASVTPQELAVLIAQSMLRDPDDTCASALLLGRGSGEGEGEGGGFGSAFDEVVDRVDTLAQLFIGQLDSYRRGLIEVRAASAQVPNFRGDEFHRDLFSIADGILKQKELSTNSDIVKAASDIIASLRTAVLFNEVKSGRDGKSCEGGHGLTIYWPESGSPPSADYLGTSFALATHWDEFLSIF